MNPLIIAFIMIYIITLISYFFSEVSNNFKRRAVNKILLAFLFCIFALATYLINYSIFDYKLLLLFSIIFAFIGDVLFLFSFKYGGITFLLTNILLMVYQILSIINYNFNPSYLVLCLVFYMTIYISFVYISKTKKFKFGEYKIPVYVYLGFITVNGLLATLSIPMLYPKLLLPIGILLFMISDYILMIYKFKFHNKNLLRSNSGFYFIGLLLIVLSLL